jgi:hypothetical protein
VDVHIARLREKLKERRSHRDGVGTGYRLVAIMTMFLSSLQGKLIAMSVVIVFVVVALASAVFVTARRGDQRQQELDHVSANATAIQGEFLLRQLRGDSADSLAAFVDGAADGYDVRALIIDLDGAVLADSADELEGSRIALEGSIVSRVAVARRYRALRDNKAGRGQPRKRSCPRGAAEIGPRVPPLVSSAFGSSAIRLYSRCPKIRSPAPGWSSCRSSAWRRLSLCRSRFCWPS